MLAKRRSSLSLDKFSCLNVAFLTCCLLVIDHAMSMSLDRQRRQYQQQNDKQLEFSELLLPEAESELLQNDMELVPAVDGNSDMYLLVPASAASQEQNLQTLAEQNESQNSANIESSSDMLMQESEDTPAVQILELPDELKTKIRNDLVANNQLEQETDLADEDKQDASLEASAEVSESMLNTIAEAAHEIETELVGSDVNNNIEKFTQAEHDRTLSNELPAEHKNSEAEYDDSNAQEQGSLEQEMIGVVKEQSNEGSLEAEGSIEHGSLEQGMISVVKEQSNEGSLEAEGSIDAEKIDKANVLLENEDINKDVQMDLESGDIERQPVNVEREESIEKINEENTEADDNSDAVEDNASLSEIEGEETEISDDIKDQNIATHASEEAEINHKKKETVDEKGDDEAQNLSEEIEKEVVTEKAEKIEAETDHTELYEAAKETQFENEAQVEIEQTKDKIQILPIETQSAEQSSLSESEESPVLTESQETEKIQSIEENVNPSELDTEEKQPAPESETFVDIENLYSGFIPTNSPSSDESEKHEQAELISESQIEEKITDEQSHQPEPNEENDAQHQEVDQIQSTNEEHEDEEKEVQITEIVQPEVGVQDNVGKDKNTKQTEIKATEAEEESQTVKSIQSAEDFQSNEEAEHVNEKLNSAEKTNESQTYNELQSVQNSQLEKDQHDAATEAVEEAQTVEDNHSEEVAQATEESIPVDEIKFVEESQSVEDEQKLENIASIDEAGSESRPLEENHTDTVEKIIEVVKPIVTDTEIESTFDETKDIDTQALTSVPEMQQTETQGDAIDQQQTESNDIKPLEISPLEHTVQESNQQMEEETSGQSTILANENFIQNAETMEDNQSQKPQDAIAIIQKPLENKDSDINNTNESEPIKEITSMLTTIVQVPSNEEPTQQQHQEHNQVQEAEQEQQPAAVETISSTTLKPFNVLDSVLNYVNASFMHQMINESESNKQEVKEDQAFSSKLRRYDGAQVWRIVVQNDRERKLADELQTKYDGQLWKEVKQEVDYLLKPQVLADAEKYIRAANLSRIVLIENLQNAIEVENPPAEEIAQLQNRKGHRLTWQAYHRLEDIHGYFDYLAKTYPDICSVEIIGYSIEKRPLKILKISNGNANNSGIWIDGGMHAREWISSAVVTYITNQIVEGWDDLPAYMRNINWYAHAVANPDGYEYSHTTDRLWRKNMRSHGRACPGVDLNRNFGYKWGGKGTSANPCSQTYRGSKAFSEPETFYISKFISNFPRETFKAYLSFHSYGQYILYPWGYDYHITNDMADLDLVARQAGTIITKSTGAKFTVGSSATTLYPAAGGSDDWAKGIAGIKYSYTIEMGDTGRYGFVLPASYIEANGKNGFTVVETLAKTITMGKNGRRRKLKAYKNH